MSRFFSTRLTVGALSALLALPALLLNFLNAWVAYWKADGWIAERHAYWFDSLDWTVRFKSPGAP